jgi:alpha-1,3-rhamnosyl/mannosyltransferase
VLAGGWGWGYSREREYFEDDARHRSVIHLGYVADADLPGLYSGAAALVYPSHYEGFGLPPVEMMACGGAVLASTAPAVREVCGDRATFIHPDDQTGWRNAMRRVMDDPDWRQELRAGVVEHARQFTWRRCAAETWRVYERVISGGEARRRAA